VLSILRDQCNLSMRRRILRAGWHRFNRNRPIMIDLRLEIGRNDRKLRSLVSASRPNH
jgi:hypothetical protein